MTAKRERLRVAVLPYGSQIGRGYVEALELEKNVTLIGMTSGFPSISDKGLDVRVDGLPRFSSSNFVHSVLDAARLHQVDLLYPANDFIGHALSCQGFNDRTLRFDSSEDRSWIFDKVEVHTRLDGRIALPKRVDPKRRSLPLFARPALGARSVGAKEIRCVHDLRSYRSRNTRQLFTEVLDGPETTVDCLSDSQGRILALFPRLRSEVRDGVTTEFSPLQVTPELVQMAVELCDVFGFVGQWFFQTKQDCAGSHCFLEASPRASGGSEFWSVLGVNMPLIDLYTRIGDEVVVPSPIHSIAFGRKTYQLEVGVPARPDQIFVDFDDTLVNENGQLQGRLVGKLIDLRGKQSDLHILSRSTSDLNVDLFELGIRGLFKQVIQLQGHSPKSAKIFGSSPLFIDDSFSERVEVGSHSAALAVSPQQFLNMEFHYHC